MIDSVTGQIQVSANVLNFEAVPLYNLTVIATDDGTPSLSANTTVTVALRYVPLIIVMPVEDAFTTV